jgi:short-subunit dehydrogenase
MPTVLILGANSDMGRALARKYAAMGFDLQLAARNPEDLKPLSADVSIRYQITCTLHAFDATKLESHADFWNNLPSIPETSILVFGYMEDNQKTLDHPEILLNTIQVNYTGAVSILNIISRTYKERKQGQIAGISSVAGLRGRGSNYLYGSAKAGLIAYLSGLRNELFSYNVHVATILPGFVYTKMTEHLQLPALLTAQANEVAEVIYKALEKKKDVVYVKWFWKWIMLIIQLIPEGIFKKLKL